MDRSMYPAFLWNVAAWSIWAVLMICMRYRVQRHRQATEDFITAELIEAP
jgi:heme exporter protein C